MRTTAWLHAVVLTLASGGALAGLTPEDWFEFVTITAPNNPGYDRPVMNPFIEGRGSVVYLYRIAKREITSEQYMIFLNTFTTQSDELADLFGRPVSWGGERDFSYGGPGERFRLRTDVDNAAQLPVLGMSWREAAYFVNWLNNDMSSDPAAIMDGAYDASTFNDDGPPFEDQDAHHPWARYWIPTFDEWFKAAHYDPDKFGQGQGGWWIYNVGSDEEPIPGPPGVGETSARWVIDDNGRPAWETPLGSYPQTLSPWGLEEISGGGAEWCEDWAPSCCGNTGRHFDGGPAGYLGFGDHADYVGGDWPVVRGSLTTIRVASKASPECDADLAEPLGELDMSDVLAYLEAFVASESVADLAPPFGVLDFSDVFAFLTAFGAGCP